MLVVEVEEVGMVRIELVVHMKSVDFVGISLVVVTLDDMVPAEVQRILVLVVDILVHHMEMHIEIYG